MAEERESEFEQMARAMFAWFHVIAAGATEEEAAFHLRAAEEAFQGAVEAVEARREAAARVWEGMG